MWSASNEKMTGKDDTLLSPSVDPTIEPILEEEHKHSANATTTILRNLSGILYTLTACFLFTCTTFIIKQLKIDLFDALVIRFILQTIAVAIFLYYKKYKLFSGTKKSLVLQFFRTLAGTFGFLGFFLSYRYLPLPDVTTLNYTRVIWTVLLGILVFGDKPSSIIILAIPLTITGVIFVAQPSFIFQSQLINSTMNSTSAVLINDQYIGFAIGIICAVASSVNVIMFKQQILSGLKASVIMFQFTLFVLFCLVLNQFYQYFIEHKTLSIFKWQYALASFMCIIQIFAAAIGQTAMKREHASVYTIATSGDIVFAIILQNLFTTKKSNFFALLGSALVISSVILIGGHKLFQDKCQKKKLKATANDIDEDSTLSV
ncbi:unnamed protein product [Didymodactylos carnosus]|uniref:EamA domain-containing protein n=2 Tax=Didymodactylos carnosus TaxID=1234261 RepID=A0A8S2HLI7_9BILA|nr:unnamed protein product [Didymodactylos carnosus]CAF3660951.1 unnamed protein product [Didymodactylos carnosus]